MTQGGRERVAADAAARGLAVEFIERMRASSLEEAAEILGINRNTLRKKIQDLGVNMAKPKR